MHIAIVEALEAHRGLRRGTLEDEWPPETLGDGRDLRL
jgi:hypothetical protein